MLLPGTSRVQRALLRVPQSPPKSPMFPASWPGRPSLDIPVLRRTEMAGEGFEPSKAEPTRLQRVPFDRSGTPPGAGQFIERARRPGRPPCVAWRLGRLAQLLGFGQRLQLFQRSVLDLADAL